MAVTSESSAVTNFPLRTFNSGPGFRRDASARDQQPTKKSATERLTETRSKYVRRGSREELEDKGEENRTHSDTHRVHQVPLSHEETQGHLFRAVPYVQDGGRSPAQKSHARLPPPVPEKPSQRNRKGSRDRTLEIVEASLGHSVRRSSNDVPVSPRGAVVSTDFSNPSSPSAGSRVRRLKEQFLNFGSAESGSESSQGPVSPTELLKSSSSSDSALIWKKRSVPSNPQDAQASDFQAPSEVDALKSKEVLQRPSRTLSEKPNLLERSKVEAADPSENPGTASEEDHDPTEESGMKSKPQQASATSSEGLSDQTRRQMERFKARYATDFAKESSQGRKISRITLKPTNHEAESKERSSSVNYGPSHKLSYGVVRPRSNISKEESPGQTSQVASKPDLFSRPRAPVNIPPVSDGNENSTEEIKQNGMSQKLNLASHHDGNFRTGRLDPDISKPMTSDDIRRLRRTKEYNISGKSPERWGDAEETSKSQGSVLEHAVHHAGDRVLVQVGGSVFPSKYHVSDEAFRSMLQPPDTRHEDSSVEVIHRRAKSDLDQHNPALGAPNMPKEDANSNRMRHHSQGDQLQHDPLFPTSARKTSAQSVLFKHAKTSPDNIKNFKEKSWAPVNFSQNQNTNDAHKQGAQEGLVQNRRALSPDTSRTRTTATELQNPQTHIHVLQQHTPRKISQEDSHEHAKSTVQSFLSGIMTSPGGGEIHDSPRTLYNDGNGNHIALEFSDNETHTSGTHWARPANGSDDANSNIQNNNRARVSVSKDVELTAVWEKREPSMTPTGKETSGKMEHRRKYLGPSMEGERTDELDKRRKFSHNSDTSSSNQDRGHLGFKVAGWSSVEPQRVKKVSLADLLSKDTTQEKTEATKSNQEGNSKWVAPPKPYESNRDDSETDSDVEHRQTKILRVKKPPRHANQKKEDKSLENLLSRIINPDDELNTLKRGTKVKARENPKAKVSRTSSKNNCGSSTAESDNEAKKEKDLAIKKSLPKRDIPHFQASAEVRKPLHNRNRNAKPVNREDAVSPPESLTSPTRRDFRRRRSKSDLGVSPRCSVSSAHSDVERFFNQMGLNESFFQGPLSPMPYSDEEEVFHEMHEYKHVRDDDDGTFSTENSDNISRGSKVSEEGLRRAKKLPDTSQSIITKNARVIKWLCQMRKARAASIS
ncbi:uncharacterized protein LOC119728980 [Patiria miniata]|uniref:Centrosome-associated FAM110 C-terminal domain-containing protein n=1 Tax=Patiria miniata TaxID=46514 RepID=A0A914A160_PATMI|nr:uncharacterized protein LOC119728980 [Patiria miniata]